MLGTVTYQASSEEQASQLLCHLDEVQAFPLHYLHKCMEAELQLSNQRSLASLPLDSCWICHDCRMGHLTGDWCWGTTSAQPQPPSPPSFHLQGMVSPEGVVEPGTSTLHLSRVSEGGDKSIKLQRKLLGKSVPKAGWQISSCNPGLGIFEHLVSFTCSGGHFPSWLPLQVFEWDLCWSNIWEIFNTLPVCYFCLGGKKAEGDVIKVYKIPKAGAGWRQSWFLP